ncbi:winged helix DNA-binding domain-containing protein [soil metagenome]
MSIIRPIPEDQLLFLRMRAQGLWPRYSTSVAGVAKNVCGIQAQDVAASRLAVHVRSVGLSADDVACAVRARDVVRTWCMRGTLHLVAAEDLPWVVELLGPGVIAASRRRYEQLGLDVQTLARGGQVIAEALADVQELTRQELAAHLARAGISVEGQALYGLIRHIALEGAICAGPERDGKPTYVPVPRNAARPPSLSKESAMDELARRYLAAYDPARLDDFVAWSGLKKGEARAAWTRITDETMEVRIADQPARMLETRASWLEEAPEEDRTVVHLLPSYDTYLIGYRGRELVIAPRYAKRLHPGGGFLRPALLVNGRVLGTWRSKPQPNGLQIMVEPFCRLAGEVRSGIETQVEHLGRFLDTNAELVLSPPSI